MLCWFSGSSSRGLPFVHDSFRPGPRPVHHRPKHPRNVEVNLTADSAKPECRDANQDSCLVTSHHVQLPSLACGERLGRGGRESDPALASRYTRRFKTCYHMKGIDPDKLYRADRRRAVSRTDSVLDLPLILNQSTRSSRAARDSRIVTSIPKSNLSLDSQAPVPAESCGLTQQAVCFKHRMQRTETAACVKLGEKAKLICRLQEKLRHSAEDREVVRSSANGHSQSEMLQHAGRAGPRVHSEAEGSRGRWPTNHTSAEQFWNKADVRLVRGGYGGGGFRELGMGGTRRRLLGSVISRRKMQQLLDDANSQFPCASFESASAL